MREVTLHKDAAFFPRLAALEPGPQSGHLYVSNHSRFLGKFGKSPAKKRSLCWQLPGIVVEKWGGGGSVKFLNSDS